ncbi:MAG TPA: hypothetical protein VJL31_07485 [Gemmatimonadales bacterium]|nr:hypothetical protein [Gemmatimonadales bacterium]
MASRIRKVPYFKTMVPNRAGQGARLLGALKDQGVNLLAVLGFPARGGAQIDLVPQNRTALTRAARKAGIRLSGPKPVFLVEGGDRPGAVAGVLARLAAARINVTAVAAARAGGGRYGGLLWVKPKDVGKAARVLKAR